MFLLEPSNLFGETWIIQTIALMPSFIFMLRYSQWVMTEKIIFLNYTSPFFDIGKMIQIRMKRKSTLFTNNEKMCFSIWSLTLILQNYVGRKAVLTIMCSIKFIIGFRTLWHYHESILVIILYNLIGGFVSSYPSVLCLIQ
jgi:hypothetical protein